MLVKYERDVGSRRFRKLGMMADCGKDVVRSACLLSNYRCAPIFVLLVHGDHQLRLALSTEQSSVSNVRWHQASEIICAERQRGYVCATYGQFVSIRSCALFRVVLYHTVAS